MVISFKKKQQKHSHILYNLPGTLQMRNRLLFSISSYDSILNWQMKKKSRYPWVTALLNARMWIHIFHLCGLCMCILCWWVSSFYKVNSDVDWLHDRKVTCDSWDICLANAPFIVSTRNPHLPHKIRRKMCHRV